MKNWKISVTVFIVGTTISALGGWFAGYSLNKEIGLITGLLLECIALVITLWIRISETEANLIEKFEESYESVKLANKIAETDEPILTELYQDFLLKQKELSQGRYELKTLEAVYEDDKRSIDYLQKNDILRSICPFSHSEEEIIEQLENRSYVTSINAHMEAAIRKVKVIRVFIFVEKKLYDLDIIQNHLNKLTEKGIECRFIFLDDSAYKQAKQIDTDFAIFGDKKVSIGTIDPATGTVNGARIRSDIETIRKYKREFQTLARIATEHKLLQNNKIK